jgi:hypothetical protein
VIAWRAVDNQNAPACSLRCSYADSCFGTVARFGNAGVNPNHEETHSKGGEAKFVNAVDGDFRAKTSSATVDGGDSTAVGWRTTDVLGFKRYDCRIVPNTGEPTGTYADIGPYEHDDGAPTIQVEPSCEKLMVTWIARGASADTLPVPAYYQVLLNDEVVRVNNSPQTPGTSVAEVLSGLDEHQVYSVVVKTADPDSEKAVSNTVWEAPCCSYPCAVERPGGGKAAAGISRESEVDFPLALGQPRPNPSRGPSAISWSIPRAQAGASYELSLFDVAGRRISTIATGMAKPGRFAHELSFRPDGGGAMANGVFFLRLRIGTQVICRTVVLVR